MKKKNVNQNIGESKNIIEKMTIIMSRCAVLISKNFIHSITTYGVNP